MRRRCSACGARRERRVAVAQKIAFGVGRIVVEVVEEVPHVHLVLRAELMIGLDDQLIVLLSDAPRNRDAAVGARDRHELQQLHRRRIEPGHRNLIVRKARPVSGSLTVALPKVPARCSAVGTVAVFVVPTFWRSVPCQPMKKNVLLR